MYIITNTMYSNTWLQVDHPQINPHLWYQAQCCSPLLSCMNSHIFSRYSISTNTTTITTIKAFQIVRVGIMTSISKDMTISHLTSEVDMVVGDVAVVVVVEVVAVEEGILSLIMREATQSVVIIPVMDLKNIIKKPLLLNMLQLEYHKHSLFQIHMPKYTCHEELSHIHTLLVQLPRMWQVYL